MAINLSEENKNTAINLSEENKTQSAVTWDEATLTWNEQDGTWDYPKIFLTKESKN